MPKVVAHHDVKDRDHWLASNVREELFGPLGITNIRTFIDASNAGKLASLLGRYEEAEQHVLAALEIAIAFGWNYHHATTLFALAQNRHRQNGALDDDCTRWLTDA